MGQIFIWRQQYSPKYSRLRNTYNKVGFIIFLSLGPNVFKLHILIKNSARNSRHH